MTAAEPPQEFDLSPTQELKPSSSVSRPLMEPDIDLEPPAELVKPARLTSLDIFRGITIVAMLIVNNAGGPYVPLEHADWHGWTPTDLIFPFFLFIVGVAIPFSFAKRAASESRGEMLLHVWARALSIVLLGALLHGFSTYVPDITPDGFKVLSVLRVTTYVVVAVGIFVLLFPWRSKKLSLLIPPIVAIVVIGLGLAIHYANKNALANGLAENVNFGTGLFRPSRFRMPGVLQRIGICYGVAGTIALLAGWRTVLLSFILLCAAYSALMLKAPFEGHTVGSLTKEDNFARSIDEAVFDRYQTMPDGKREVLAKHTYGEYPDPEGLVSTLPAIGSVLLGILVGYSLHSPRRTNVEKCARLLANGVLVAIVGVLLSWWLMPINKKIWTPSFTVFTAGMAMLTLGAIFYITDIKGRRAWAWPFKVYGMNAIAAYVFSGLLMKILGIVRWSDRETGKDITALAYSKNHLLAWAHQAGDMWSKAFPSFPPLDSAPNLQLVLPIALVLVMLVVLSIMYAFKVFLKV